MRTRSTRRIQRCTVALAAWAGALAVGIASVGLACSTYKPDPGDANTADATPGADATPDAGPVETGSDASPCAADLQIDPKNCGRCGHDCLGGACAAGKCEARVLASVNTANFRNILVTPSYVYAATFVTLLDVPGGIWRVPRSGGLAEPYVTLHDAHAMAVLGGMFYFVVHEDPGGTIVNGGLYSCPLDGAAPCMPTRIASATKSSAVFVDKGRVFYTDDRAGKGLMVHVPPAAPTPFRPNGSPVLGLATRMYVDDEQAFITTNGATFLEQRANLLDVLPDGGVTVTYAYVSATAVDAMLLGTPSALYFTAYDYKETTNGIVRRLPRDGGLPCDLGGSTNVRPYGVYADTARVYWANQGDGVAPPYANGSLVSCEQAGCCTKPDILWTGQQPSVITGDDEALYFASSTTGNIYKLAKP